MSIAAKVNIPESVLLSLREPAESICLEMKRTLAMRYYNEKKLSLGQCAELAEMNEKLFINFLARYKISIFNYNSENELIEDICNA